MPITNKNLIPNNDEMLYDFKFTYDELKTLKYCLSHSATYLKFYYCSNVLVCVSNPSVEHNLANIEDLESRISSFL